MLNKTDFVVLAGNPEKWDKQIGDAVAAFREKTHGACADDVLCDHQTRQWFAGRRSASIVETVYGYSVRLDSGLANRQKLSGRGLTKAQAIDFGIEWANQDPENREFYVSIRDIEKTVLDFLVWGGT